MKIRKGFVSNSSSSSFVISTDKLTQLQINLIKNHHVYARGVGMHIGKGDAWWIYEENGMLTGHTDMNNFSMYDFFEKIGVDLNQVEWRGG